jgi:MFS_1 like family
VDLRISWIFVLFEIRAGGPEKCPSQYKESDDKTFYLYFLLRFLGNACMNAGVTLLDPIALTMIKRYGGEFGRERIFSTIGMAIFSPITGFLIDYNSQQLGKCIFTLNV